MLSFGRRGCGQLLTLAIRARAGVSSSVVLPRLEPAGRVRKRGFMPATGGRS